MWHNLSKLWEFISGVDFGHFCARVLVQIFGRAPGYPKFITIRPMEYGGSKRSTVNSHEHASTHKFPPTAL